MSFPEKKPPSFSVVDNRYSVGMDGKFCEDLDFRAVSKTQTVDFSRNHSFRLRIAVVYTSGPDAELTFGTTLDKAYLLLGCFRILMEDGSAEPGIALPIDTSIYRVFSKYGD